MKSVLVLPFFLLMMVGITKEIKEKEICKILVIFFLAATVVVCVKVVLFHFGIVLPDIDLISR